MRATSFLIFFAPLFASALCAQTNLDNALNRAARGQCDAVLRDLQKFPDDRVALLAIAQCHIAAKRFDAASPVILRLQREFPSDPDVLYTTANYHMRAWNDVIGQMYQKTPSSWRVNELSAEVFETQGKYDEAIAEYRKAVAKNPKALNLHYRLGRLSLQRSHEPAALEQARKEFEEELALNPSDAVAEYQVAQIAASQGNRADSAERFERAAQLRPDFPEALIAIAKLRSGEKKYAEAVLLLERAVRLQPQSESAHYALLMAYQNAGRTADAQREKAQLDKLQQPPEGEFSDFLKRLGEKTP